MESKPDTRQSHFSFLALIACVALAAQTAQADSARSCAYDSQGRVRQVQRDGRTVTYAYDYAGRLYSRTEAGSTTKRLYNGNEVAAEYGAVRKRYLHGAGIDNVLAFHEASVRYLHRDGLNSVALATDASNRVIERVSYDSFGAPTFRDAEYRPAGPGIGNRDLFTGREWEPDLGLYNYRARFYCPASGRFLSPDPVGQSGGLNLYAYCGNNPVNLVDPSGLESCSANSRVPDSFEDAFWETAAWQSGVNPVMAGLSALKSASEGDAEGAGMSLLGVLPVGKAGKAVEEAIQSGIIPGVATRLTFGWAWKIPVNEIPGRLSNEQMLALQAQHGTEFAQIYVAGEGAAGGGGKYYLIQGTAEDVPIPIGPDVRVISHTHPERYLNGEVAPLRASPGDIDTMQELQSQGSPQRKSVILPANAPPFEFGI
jgi:RHS repeat-associated protein